MRGAARKGGPYRDSEKAAADAALKEVEGRVLLAIYVEKLVPANTTGEAKSTLLFELKRYAQEVVAASKIRRRADRNAENIMRSHVLDSVSFVQNKQDDLGDKLADWCKWIGFTFLGLAIQQGIHVSSEKPIAWGSVKWLLLDTIIALCLLFIGAKFNKPWEYFTQRFRNR